MSFLLFCEDVISLRKTNKDMTDTVVANGDGDFGFITVVMVTRPGYLCLVVHAHAGLNNNINKL